MSHSLFLFDDERRQSWDPFALTRPVGELLFGAFLLTGTGGTVLGLALRGSPDPSSLSGFSEPGQPAGGGSRRHPDGIGTGSSRAPGSPLSGRPPPSPGRAGHPVPGRVRWWVGPFPPEPPYLTPDALPGPRHFGRRPEAWSCAGAGSWRRPGISWPGMPTNSGRTFRISSPDSPPTNSLGAISSETVFSPWDAESMVEPASVFDVREGPIRLSDGVVVRSHTRLEGPAFVGPGSTLLGGSLSEVSIGPVCKVRGELESSIILGYSNKAHDGFLGHAYARPMGESGSLHHELRPEEQLWSGSGGGASRAPKDTGLMKVGCFLGDHVKTGIGTFLNTGTVVGAGSNLFGGRMPPTYVPPFSWGTRGRTHRVPAGQVSGGGHSGHGASGDGPRRRTWRHSSGGPGKRPGPLRRRAGRRAPAGEGLRPGKRKPGQLPSW